MTSLRFTLKKATRKRCNIFKLNSDNLSRYYWIDMDLFHFFYETMSINFSIYIRVGDELVEYVKPNELNIDLLNQIKEAYLRDPKNVEPCIEKDDHSKFEKMIRNIRQQKINKLLEKNPGLDRATIEVFSDLSSVSQLITTGGITSDVLKKVEGTTINLVDFLMTNNKAIGTLSRMIYNDPTLYDHTASVAMISTVIGLHVLAKPLPRPLAQLLAQCGLYHDIGKTFIPSAILNKPGRFTTAEFEVMKTHTTSGHEELNKTIAEGAPIPDLVSRVAWEHHEKFSGEGYPKGLRGRYEEDNKEGIHLFSRIITIADVYSALLMKRVYKPAYEAATAIRIMANTAKKDYDPDIFYPFLKSVVKSIKDQSIKVIDKKDRSRVFIVENKTVKRVG